MDINNNINDATNNIESGINLNQVNNNTPPVAPVENVGDLAENTNIDPKLASEEDIGEHDIVIEEDFQINLDVADVSPDFSLSAPTAPGTDNKDAPPLELGTEQTGNITF